MVSPSVTSKNYGSFTDNCNIEAAPDADHTVSDRHPSNSRQNTRAAGRDSDSLIDKTKDSTLSRFTNLGISESPLKMKPNYGRNQSSTKNQTEKLQSEVDGLQAWVTLACIFIVNANTLGALKIYGLIFEEIVSQHYYNREEAAWPISTASTVQNLAGVLTPMLALRISWRCIEILQTALIVTANIGAYFSRHLALDILCLGIIQGVALSIRYNMNVVINNEYFVKYRATAMGVSLAGSTCGVFMFKPIISYVLDNSNHNFRNAYLALGILMSLNIFLNLFIRKPKEVKAASSTKSEKQTPQWATNGQDIAPAQPSSTSPPAGTLVGAHQSDQTFSTIKGSLCGLLRNPSIHCIWLMQTIYFYISRTYTIFIVDYGIDNGLARAASRDLLEFWVYGEIAGRLLLGGFVDSRIISLKWNIVLVNLLLALSGFALLVKPASFALDASLRADLQNAGSHSMPTDQLAAAPSVGKDVSGYFYWYFGVSVALVAALSSLTNMLIVPFGQEYLGKKNVPWAYALGSIVTAGFLLLRPSLIGLSRDHYKSYDLLIIVMSTAPCLYALVFVLIEPILSKHKYTQIRDPPNGDNVETATARTKQQQQHRQQQQQ